MNTALLFKHTCRPYCTKTAKKPYGSRKVTKFFNENAHLQFLQKFIPEKYLKSQAQNKLEHVYLISPEIAKIAAEHVVNSVKQNQKQLVCETNPGLGLISQILLEEGVPLVRMFEQCQNFRSHLKGLADMFPNRVELFTKDFFQLHRYAYFDKHDKGNRVETLMRGVPRRSWAEDPVMTIVGTMPSKTFLKHFLHSFMLQSGPSVYGRIQLFTFMPSDHYKIFTATNEDSLRFYQLWSIISNLFLEFELLEKVPRKFFLPWLRVKKDTQSDAIDSKNLYFVKINMKKNYPVPEEQFLPLFYFIKQFYGKGNNLVIPKIETWIPGCGMNVMAPKLDHKQYFKEMSIFTKMRELTPLEILGVFREVINFPAYTESPFYGMLENELLKIETIETSTDSAAIEPTIIKDLEMKLN